MHAAQQPLLDAIRKTGKLDDASLAALKDAVGKFKASYRVEAPAPKPTTPAAGKPAAAPVPPAAGDKAAAKV
jgi:hypothetical protein